MKKLTAFIGATLLCLFCSALHAHQLSTAYLTLQSDDQQQFNG